MRLQLCQNYPSQKGFRLGYIYLKFRFSPDGVKVTHVTAIGDGALTPRKHCNARGGSVLLHGTPGLKSARIYLCRLKFQNEEFGAFASPMQIDPGICLSTSSLQTRRVLADCHVTTDYVRMLLCDMVTEGDVSLPTYKIPTIFIVL